MLGVVYMQGRTRAPVRLVRQWPYHILAQPSFFLYEVKGHPGLLSYGTGLESTYVHT